MSEEVKKSSYTGYTEARKKANKKWAENKAQISIRISQELKAKVDAYCAAHNEPIAKFVVRAMQEQIERDKQV